MKSFQWLLLVWVFISSHGIGRGQAVIESKPDPELVRLQAEADKGNPQAMDELAMLYVKGKDAKADLAKAFALFSQASDLGYAPAECHLAWCYQYGKGTAADPFLALAQYRKSGAAGFVAAQDELGKIFNSGSLDVKIDQVEARRWFERAALQQDPYSIMMTVYYLVEGLGGPKDEAAALRWALRGGIGKDGNDYCRYVIASLYASSKANVPHDDSWAWTWSSLVRPEKLSNDGMEKDFVLRRTLASRMSDEEIGTATRRALAFEDIERQDGFAISPTLDGQATATSYSEKPIAFLAKGHEILIPVFIQGSGPFTFLLDSGAASSDIDEEVGKRLKLNVSAVASRGSIRGPEITPVFQTDYSVGEAHIRQGVFEAMPMGRISHAAERQIDGTLGYDFISRFIVEIDYDAKIIYLHDPNFYHYNGQEKTIPLSLHEGLPWIPADIGRLSLAPIHTPILIDTGADSGIMVSHDFDQKHNFSSLVAKVVPGRHFAGSIGETSTTEGRFLSLTIGDNIVSKPMAICFPETNPNPNRTLIGGEILSKFRIILDYRARTAIFEPGKKFDEVDSRNWYGLEFDPQIENPKDCRVLRVEEDSPASSAGMMAEDLIVSCDGQAVANPRDLYVKLMQGDAHVLVVRRAGGQQVVSIKPIKL